MRQRPTPSGKLASWRHTPPFGQSFAEWQTRRPLQVMWQLAADTPAMVIA